MNEVIIFSLMVSSLGLEAVLAGSWICATQAEVEREQEEEEDILTRYDSENPQTTTARSSQPNGHSPSIPEWEYKIVRAQRDLFRNPKIFEKLCKEEAIAGWVMVEKLDDRRVRFRRPTDSQLPSETPPPIDPYRCSYGSGFDPTAWLAGFAFLVAIVLPAYLGYALVSNTLNRIPQDVPRLSPMEERE
ncbi:MAG: hypothetical protein ACP5D7_03290 [Limnospira sp.]